MSTSLPKVLVIAGSDSSGGAGLEADQKVLAAHGVYACTATTALTAQNTLGVSDIHITPPGFLAKQIDAVLSDVDCDMVKIGMLASADSIDVVADKLIHWHKGRIVLDPVIVSTSGSQLLPEDAVGRLVARLQSDWQVELITPNIPEAVLLAQKLAKEEATSAAGDNAVGPRVTFRSPESLEEMKHLVQELHGKLKTKAILLKGGHVPFHKVSGGGYARAVSEDDKQCLVDVLFDGSAFTNIESAYLRSKNTHGTGCSLASAIASNLARGVPLQAAVKQACRYVAFGIESSQDVGRGSGPINHFHSVQMLPFTPGRFIEYMLERDDVRHVWQVYTHHEFANRMGNGTLPLGLFQDYLVQDYLYLVHFARTNALASYKSTDMNEITASAQIVLHIDREMALHLEYCDSFGLSKEDILQHKESLACVAYSRWVLDIGQSQDWLALQMSLAPCLLGYGQVARRLADSASSQREGNKYWKWVENYIADDYQEAVSKGSALIEKHVQKQSPTRIEELVQIFIRGVEMEIQFWNVEGLVQK